MRPRDVEAVLAKAARNADGSYRVLASKALTGKPVGPFRYYGTRPDDPNDIFPHEHRRELRGLGVFAAWLNHDDSRSINTLDTLVRDGGALRRAPSPDRLRIDARQRQHAGRRPTRAGNEFLWESRPTIITMLTLGLLRAPVDQGRTTRTIRRSAGSRASYFLPEAWKPEYRQPGVRQRAAGRSLLGRADRRGIPRRRRPRASCRPRGFRDPRATEYMIDTLLARKRKVLTAWLNGTNPIVDPALTRSGR